MLGHARRLANGKPLILTCTHFHPEHAYGAQVFAPLSTIVYNRSQLDELHEKAYPYADLFRTFGETVAAELEGFEMVEPDIVYDGEADIDLGGRIVQLRTYGETHTKGDSWVFLPEERILFTGDLVENKGFAIFPYFPPDDTDVNGDRWIVALEMMERLDPAIVVPGHGDVGDVGVVTAAREYLVQLRDETRRLAAEGVGDRRHRRPARARVPAAPPGLGAARVDRPRRAQLPRRRLTLRLHRRCPVQARVGTVPGHGPGGRVRSGGRSERVAAEEVEHRLGAVLRTLREHVARVGAGDHRHLELRHRVAHQRE